MEQIQMKKSNLFLILFFLGFLIACDDNGVFDEFKSIENQNWNYKNKVVFEFKILDTISKNNIYINIRNNNEYSFKNLNLVAQMYLANTKITDSLTYKMTNEQGYFLGEGLSVLENKLLFKENFKFSEKGDYKVILKHFMFKDRSNTQLENLKGISDVGLRIEKIN